MTSEVESSALAEEESVLSVADTIENSIIESKIEEINNAEETTISQVIIENSIIEQQEKQTEDGIEYEVPSNQNGFKSWMPYTALGRNTTNYKMLMEYGWIDENGLWRINDMYCVALGSYYSTRVGDIFKVELSSGEFVYFITADHKADAHTDSTNRYTTANGCIAEFIVSYSDLNSSVKAAGSVSALSRFKNTTYKRIIKTGNIFD